MTSGDVVGWLVWGFSEKRALRLGLFLLPPPELIIHYGMHPYMYMYIHITCTHTMHIHVCMYTLQKLNGCFDRAMVILIAVLSDTQMFVDVCLSSVILNVCPRVFGMLVHM